MNARRGRHLDHERIDVRLSDPGEIAAALPSLLGFRPRESVVLVSLRGARGARVGLTVRADIPPEEHVADVAAVLTRSVCTDTPRGALLAVVSDAGDVSGPGPGRWVDGEIPELPHRPLVREVTLALARAGVPVREALLVRAGRWWSYDCPHACCAPAAGTPLPTGVTALEVASVASGVVVERDRGDLARRITGPGGAAGGAMAAACEAVAEEFSGRLLDVGADAMAEESWSSITAGVDRCRPEVSSPALTDREVARILWGLRDRGVRDRALGLATGTDAAAAESLWTDCTRRAPAPLDAAPATLLAVSAWLRGDGAMANVALTRALVAEPGYALARLLAQALAACVGPEDLRRLIGTTLSGPGPRPC